MKRYVLISGIMFLFVLFSFIVFSKINSEENTLFDTMEEFLNYFENSKKPRKSVSDYSIIDGKVEMSLNEFMEEFMEEAEKKYKSGNKEPLKKMLEVTPSLALSEDQKDWENIIAEASESGKYRSSCKACHIKFKKNYKALYRKRLVLISKEILNLK